MHQHAGIDRQTCESRRIRAAWFQPLRLDNGHASNYLALWGADSKAVLSARPHPQTASQIIEKIE